ncbi:zf-HC2 domain-containing protein [Desulforamulus hydrothermalis]|uniref:Anti-sigma-W factor RsiW n=1 Tax=Desulforamulus hydrothermalis Lam5 = DSM 18033 TaxID=1121428 RepID=K8DZR6_9FIRM|nr:zf-HC2 domain-containing protein [Desulforamulus hydrothermalis]CCO08535.1 putative transmembrane anti-sigma factor [Desulforamulus hydrothermalis Lam5 = DSM 18033]SHH02709.1 Transmembrane transcriptional regulator (anti-sigma factor RsiW) [Desulforamulus hydrothermalis Lam5 = DSM 18033]
MRCQDALEMLSPYLDGALDPAEQAAVQDHLAGCPSCRAEWEELRSCLSLLQELPEIAPPAGFRAGLMEKIDRLALPAQAPRHTTWFARINGVVRQGWYRTAAVAAVLAMTLGLTALWEKEGHQFIPVQNTAQEPALVEQLSGSNLNQEKPADGQVKQQAGVVQPGQTGKATTPAQSSQAVNKPAEQGAVAGAANQPEKKFMPESYRPQSSEGMTARTAVLKLDVPELDAALKSVAAISQQAGGSIVVPYSEDNGIGMLALKVPAGRSQTVERQLKALGEVITDMPVERDLSAQHKQAVALLEQLQAQQADLAAQTAAKDDPATAEQLTNLNHAISQQIKLIKQLEDQSNYTIINLTLQ